MAYKALRGFNYLDSDDRCEVGDLVDESRFTVAQRLKLARRGVIRKASAIETKSSQKIAAGVSVTVRGRSE